RRPDGQVHGRAPQGLAVGSVEAKRRRRVVGEADAAAGVDAAVGDSGARVEVEGPLELPEPLSRGGVEAVDAVVAGTEVDLAAGDGGRRFDVPLGGEVPALLARGGVEAVELAGEVGVHPLADVEPAVGQRGAGVHVLHGALVVEAPDGLAGGAVEAVDGAG